MQKKIKKTILITLIPLAIILLTSSSGGNSHYEYPEGWQVSELPLRDGTYQGEATGFREGLIVEITVTDGQLSNVEVIDHNEIGRRYWETPIEKIPGRIVEEQYTEVDGITGATATSLAIMVAVEDALSKAQS